MRPTRRCDRPPISSRIAFVRLDVSARLSVQYFGTYRQHVLACGRVGVSARLETRPPCGVSYQAASRMHRGHIGDSGTLAGWHRGTVWARLHSGNPEEEGKGKSGIIHENT